jgi:AcrR family transcriptional regulator
MAHRGHLNRTLILETGLRIADAEGMGALSLRRVARELEVTPMALYRYVDDKDDLLDGIGDYVLARLDLGDSADEDWTERLRRAARSYRELLVDHPAAVSITMSRPLLTPNALRVAEELLELLAGAGFDADEAVRLYQQIARFVLGLVFLETEASAAGAAQTGKARRAQLRLDELPAAEFPRIRAAASYLMSPPDFDRNFDIGLDILLAGLGELLERKRR